MTNEVADAARLVRGSGSKPGSAFVLLRFTLIISTSYLLFAQKDFSPLPAIVNWLIFGALLSNVGVMKLAAKLVESTVFTTLVLLADMIWITLALSLTGNFSSDFFLLYFFLLFLAAIGERLHLVVIGSGIVLAGYVYAIAIFAGSDSLAAPQHLTRIPFLLSVATFNGYLVQRVRREKRRANEEAGDAHRLREARQKLGEHAERLEHAYADLTIEIEERKRAEKEQKTAEQALRQSNQELTKLSATKSRFLSTVSHELRTPLSAIKTSMDVVRRGKAGSLEPSQVKFLDVAARNIDRLTTLIDDLLDLAKVEAGKLEFRFSEVDAKELLEDSFATFEQQAKAQAIRFEVASPDSLPKVRADPELGRP